MFKSLCSEWTHIWVHSKCRYIYGDIGNMKIVPEKKSFFFTFDGNLPNVVCLYTFDLFSDHFLSLQRSILQKGHFRLWTGEGIDFSSISTFWPQNFWTLGGVSAPPEKIVTRLTRQIFHRIEYKKGGARTVKYEKFQFQWVSPPDTISGARDAGTSENTGLWNPGGPPHSASAFIFYSEKGLLSFTHLRQIHWHRTVQITLQLVSFAFGFAFATLYAVLQFRHLFFKLWEESKDYFF